MRSLRVLLAVLMSVLAFHILPVSAQESLVDTVKERGTLRAGVKNDYPPGGYLNEGGDWVGIDVEMAQYIAKKLGVKLEMMAVTSRTRIPMLVNGNVDMVVNINPTRKRAETIDFTSAYFLAGTTMLVQRGSDINGVEDLVPPRKVGSVQGSADAPGLLAQQPKADIVYFQEFPQVLMALKRKRVDAMITASVTLAKMAKENPDLEVVMPPFKPDPWAIGVRHDDSKWRLAIEEAIMDAWSDGTIARLHEKYIGTPVNFKVSVWPDYYQK